MCAGKRGGFTPRDLQDGCWGAPLPWLHFLALGLALAQKQVMKRKSLLLALRLMVR